MARILHSIAAGVAAAAFTLSAPVQAQQQKLKIGFITTLSGPPAIIGKHMKDSVEVALEHLGGKVGGLETEVIYGDDQFKPDVGVQLAEEMLKKHQVDFVAGIIWSNVMMAVVPVVTGAGKIMVGSNAGASPLAGSQCNELYFSTSWNNDQSPEAMGKYLQDKGVNDLYVLAPNYQAGKDMVAGLKRYYKGRIVEEIYTKFQQQDYQAEISQLRSKNPKAVFAFYPGGMGIQFVKQYVQAGLRDQIPSTRCSRWTRPRCRRSGKPPSASTRRASGARTSRSRRARSTWPTSAGSSATRRPSTARRATTRSC